MCQEPSSIFIRGSLDGVRGNSGCQGRHQSLHPFGTVAEFLLFWCGGWQRPRNYDTLTFHRCPEFLQPLLETQHGNTVVLVVTLYRCAYVSRYRFNSIEFECPFDHSKARTRLLQSDRSQEQIKWFEILD